MRDEEPRLGALRGAAHIILWIVTSALALVDLALARGLAQAITMRVGSGLSTEAADRLREAGSMFGWLATLTDMLITLAIGLIGLAAIIFLEYYFRRGAARRQLLRRALIVLAVEALLAGLFYGVTLLLL